VTALFAFCGLEILKGGMNTMIKVEVVIKKVINEWIKSQGKYPYTGMEFGMSPALGESYGNEESKSNSSGQESKRKSRSTWRGDGVSKN
jgi:hypothetical protein